MPTLFSGCSYLVLQPNHDVFDKPGYATILFIKAMFHRENLIQNWGTMISDTPLQRRHRPTFAPWTNTASWADASVVLSVPATSQPEWCEKQNRCWLLVSEPPWKISVQMDSNSKSKVEQHWNHFQDLNPKKNNFSQKWSRNNRCYPPPSWFFDVDPSMCSTRSVADTPQRSRPDTSRCRQDRASDPWCHGAPWIAPWIS